MSKAGYWTSRARALGFILLWPALCSAGRAALLFNPGGGTVLFDGEVPDDEVETARPLGFSGSFFGSPRSSVAVSTNGNLNFGGDSVFANAPLGTGSSRIAVLWDDFVPAGGAAILETVVPGGSYSVTWKNFTTLDGGGSSSVQVTWFGSTTLVGTFLFQPDDIAFSYERVDALFRKSGGELADAATVGLNAGDGLTLAALPGDSDGYISNGQKGLLPLEDYYFILFRPNGSNGYDVSIQNVPEPTLAGSLLAGLGIIFGGVRLRPRAS